MTKKPELIVALDPHDLKKTKEIIDLLYPRVKIFKVGSQLLLQWPKAIEEIGKKGAKVFLDFKFYDIPNTVYLSVAAGTGTAYQTVPVIAETERKDIKDKVTPPVFMMTVHILGGKEMLEAAVKGAKDKAEELNIPKPFIVGVTVLTSEDKQANTEQDVLKMAILAKNAGLDGVVCSVHEAGKIREKMGEDFLIVTPGIRPQDYPSDGQKRKATVKQAVEAQANYIVVGRPILEADNPLKATEEILKDL